jgi:transposase InsO family protein
LRNVESKPHASPHGPTSDERTKPQHGKPTSNQIRNCSAIAFLSYFNDLKDTRQPRKVLYPLDEVLLRSLLAVRAGAETFSGMLASAARSCRCCAASAHAATQHHRVNAHWFLTLADAQEKLEAWRRYYNEERPHGAIGNKVPISLQIPGGAFSPTP